MAITVRDVYSSHERRGADVSQKVRLLQLACHELRATHVLKHKKKLYSSQIRYLNEIQISEFFMTKSLKLDHT